MQNTTQQIIKVLTEIPATRDDIDLLCNNLVCPTDKPVKFALYVDRMSRKLQAEYPLLRGLGWEARQRKARKVADKMRSQEKIEDLTKLFQNAWFEVEKIELKTTLFTKLKSLLWK